MDETGQAGSPDRTGAYRGGGHTDPHRTPEGAQVNGTHPFGAGGTALPGNDALTNGSAPSDDALEAIVTAWREPATGAVAGRASVNGSGTPRGRAEVRSPYSDIVAPMSPPVSPPPAQPPTTALHYGHYGEGQGWPTSVSRPEHSQPIMSSGTVYGNASSEPAPGDAHQPVPDRVADQASPVDPQTRVHGDTPQPAYGSHPQQHPDSPWAYDTRQQQPEPARQSFPPDVELPSGHESRDGFDPRGGYQPEALHGQGSYQGGYEDEPQQGSDDRTALQEHTTQHDQAAYRGQFNGYPEQHGRPTQGGYADQGAAWSDQGGYPATGGYPTASGHAGQGGQPRSGGYPDQGGYGEPGDFSDQDGHSEQHGYPHNGQPRSGYPEHGFAGQEGYAAQDSYPVHGGDYTQGGYPLSGHDYADRSGHDGYASRGEPGDAEFDWAAPEPVNAPADARQAGMHLPAQRVPEDDPLVGPLPTELLGSGTLLASSEPTMPTFASEPPYAAQTEPADEQQDRGPWHDQRVNGAEPHRDGYGMTALGGFQQHAAPAGADPANPTASAPSPAGAAGVHAPGMQAPAVPAPGGMPGQTGSFEQTSAGHVPAVHEGVSSAAAGRPLTGQAIPDQADPGQSFGGQVHAGYAPLQTPAADAASSTAAEAASTAWEHDAPELPQRVPSPPDVPQVPEVEPTVGQAGGAELARIATYLREDEDDEPSLDDRPDGFDIPAVLRAVQSVPGVRDATVRRNADGLHTLRLELQDDADPGSVSRAVARLLNERMGLAAEPNPPEFASLTGPRAPVRSLNAPHSALPGYGREARRRRPVSGVRRTAEEARDDARQALSWPQGLVPTSEESRQQAEAQRADAQRAADQQAESQHEAWHKEALKRAADRQTEARPGAAPAAGQRADGDRSAGHQHAEVQHARLLNPYAQHPHAQHPDVRGGDVRSGDLHGDAQSGARQSGIRQIQSRRDEASNARVASSIQGGEVRAAGSADAVGEEAVGGERLSTPRDGNASEHPVLGPQPPTPVNRDAPPALIPQSNMIISPRVLIDQVEVSTHGVDAFVEVRLIADGNPAVGVASGPAVDGYILRLSAAAAASAVDQLLVDVDTTSRARCYIEHAAVVQLGGCDVALVVLLLVYDSWVEQLTGSAVCAGDPRQAVVRATLAAVNRRLEALLP